jgi:pyrophosphatase PpaX
VIKAVIFDSDGTLLDSFTAIVGAYAYVAERFGYKAPSAEEVAAQLRKAPPLYTILKTFFPEQDVDDLLSANNEYITNFFNDSVRQFDHLEELLQTLHDAGLKMGVVTGGNHKVLGVLEHNSIAHYFTSVVHCERVTTSKPDPEGYLLAVQECGVAPHEAVMVGDSPNDILAGKNGGAALTFGVTHGHGSREDLQAVDSDYIVDSLDALCDELMRLTKA